MSKERKPIKFTTPLLKRLLKSRLLNAKGRREAYGELVRRRHLRWR